MIHVQQRAKQNTWGTTSAVRMVLTVDALHDDARIAKETNTERPRVCRACDKYCPALDTNFRRERLKHEPNSRSETLNEDAKKPTLRQNGRQVKNNTNI